MARAGRRRSGRPRSLVHAAVAVAALVVAAGVGVGCSSDDGVDGLAGQPVATTPEVEPDEEAVAARDGDAVYRVETDGCGYSGWGTAFAVDDHHLVTNRHVIANDTSPIVRRRDGTEAAGRVIGASSEHDIAVIEVDDAMPRALAWVPATSLEATDRLVVLGFPRPARRFTVSAGSIVAFQGEPSVAPEAILSDVPIDRGNSGGPALRPTGGVVGVVTLMTLDTDEPVAIVFTADQVAPVVDQAIAAPTDVVSDCGFGPDYVPPAPPSYGITSAPPPPPTTDPSAAASPPTSQPPPTEPVDLPPPATPLTTGTTVLRPCPALDVAVRVNEVRATPNPDDPETTAVEVNGFVDNGTDVPIRIVDVVAELDDIQSTLVPAALAWRVVDPGTSVGWYGQANVVGPARWATASVSWRWTDPAYNHCPHG